MKLIHSLKVTRLFMIFLIPFLIYSSDSFSVPVVTGISPLSGPITGGQTVTINGTGFTGTSAVNFGKISAAAFTVVNDKTITATTPSHIPFVVDVTVTVSSKNSVINQNDRYAFVNGDWTAFIPNFKSGNIITSEVNSKLVNPIPISVGKRPNDVLMTFDGSTAYVANSSSNNISVIDVKTMTVTHTIPTNSSFPILISLSFDTALQAYVGYTSDFLSNTVTQIDLTHEKILNIFNVGTHPSGGVLTSAIDPAALYVVNSGSSNITRIDLKTLTVTDTIFTGVGSIPSFITLAPDGSTAYFTDNNLNGSSFRQLLNVNTANPSLLTALTGSTFDFSGVDQFPKIVISSPAGSYSIFAYITNTKSNTVTVVDITDPNNISVACSFQVKDNPNGAAMTPDGSTLYVCNAGSNALSIASDLTSCTSTIVDLIVGTTPANPTITPDQAPLAFFIASPIQASIGQPVTFDASQSVSPVGSISEYVWDFGDGTTATGRSVIYIYSSAGSYHVTLTVINSGGTSTASSSSFFNGQSMIRNGGPTAQYTLPINVQANSNVSTTTSLTTSPNTSYLDEDIRFTAHVTASDNSIPTGTVQFTVDGMNIENPVTLVGGNASIANYPFFSSGTYSIGAVYTPSSGSIYSPSIAIQTDHLVNQDPSSTDLTLSPANSSLFGQLITFTAVVTTPQPIVSNTPTGVVQFIYTSSNSPFPVIFGTVSLDNTGTAVFSTSTLPVDNTYQIYASYQGDNNHAASETDNSSYIVNPDLTKTTVTTSVH